MKIKTVILFSFVFLILCNLSTLAQTKPPDSTKTPTQSVQYQGQIDTLRAELEKVKKDAYEKAIGGANSSVFVATLVVSFVGVLAVVLGFVAAFKIRATTKEMGQELDKAKGIREEVVKLCEEIKQMKSGAEEDVAELKQMTKESKVLKAFPEETKAIISEEDAERAVEVYEKLTDRIVGKDAETVYNKLALVYYRLGRYEEAIVILKKLFSINPKNPAVYNNWGVALYVTGRYEEALEKYEKATEIGNNYADAYYNWGTALIKLRKYQDAAEKLKQALAIEPQFPRAFFNLGLALSGLKKYQDAIQSFKKATEIMPEFAESYSSWANVLNELGKHEEAIEKCREAIKHNPRYADAYLNWGVALNKLGKYEEAIERYKEAIKFRPEYAEAYNNWGAALIELRKFEEGLNKLNKAIDLKKDFAEPYYNLAILFARQKDKREMHKYLEFAVKLSEEHRKTAKTDEDFKDYWNDPDFKKLVE